MPLKCLDLYKADISAAINSVLCFIRNIEHLTDTKNIKRNYHFFNGFEFNLFILLGNTYGSSHFTYLLDTVLGKKGTQFNFKIISKLHEMTYGDEYNSC